LRIYVIETVPQWNSRILSGQDAHNGMGFISPVDRLNRKQYWSPTFLCVTCVIFQNSRLCNR